MRWSIIRLIWVRELRDQLRDRRTLFMIAVLPIFLYPVAGIGGMYFFRDFFTQSNKVRIADYRHLPEWSPRFHPRVRAASWFAAVPPGPGSPLVGVERLTAAASLHAATLLEYPPLVNLSTNPPTFLADYYEARKDPGFFVVDLADYPSGFDPHDPRTLDRSDLDTGRIDLLLVVPPDFAEQLDAGERPSLYIFIREDDRSRLVYNRMTAVLGRWKTALKETRLLRRGLPSDFDEPFRESDAEKEKSATDKVSYELSKILALIFPFVLVMWSLAGALYPAVDLCAGEKERGTMETLLISPASREEIVWGKFLTIWVFSAATALLNLLSMGLTTWVLSGFGKIVSFQLSYLFWASVLLVPLSAFFSAMCLSVGVYARSSKEGQYYLMPLFLLTMPLVFLTLVPGVELNHFYSMVPVTGVALLLKALMKTGTVGATLMYFVPVLAPMVIYSWLALRWAIEQFQREEVLFREAERLDFALWLKRLFREKDLLPSTGQAWFCFLVVLILHWVTMTALAARLAAAPASPQIVVSLAVIYVAILAVPLFMALLLTRRPAWGLGLRLPPAWSWPAAVLLAVLLLVAGAVLTLYIVQNPTIKQSLEASQPALRDGGDGALAAAWGPALVAVMVLALSQAVCEEVVFRGFVLTGLRRRFRPWAAILISSFLFAVFQLNVFQCVPHFLLGVVTGFLAWRTGSILPSIVFHFVYNTPLYLLQLVNWASPPALLRWMLDQDGNPSPLALALGAASALLAFGLIVGISFLRKRPDPAEAQLAGGVLLIQNEGKAAG
jgi:sodium transport system permease protein